jgi:pyruvate dehydrogenase E1 component alpha subunit
MHLADKAVGFMGSSAIVGNSIPVGVGLGLSIQIRQTNALSWVFLGDAATEEGVYYESVNFSVLKKLPVLFMCENNGFSVYSDESVRRPPNQKIFEVAEFLGCKAIQVDGNNPTESHRVVSEMADFVRSGGGPGLIEFHTFRQREHCGPNFDDHLEYRSPEYLARWRDNDPISRLKVELQSPSDVAWISSVTDEIEVEIDIAFAAAVGARFPTVEECEEVLYAK